ncbi:MAG TPA: type I phosphomannose isomerase catalytic subunit [Thermomicrobiales bacterium]|nr:type I phosphomannose isomerase catalytic subunit [Thermomicrobiales bacterium]
MHASRTMTTLRLVPPDVPSPPLLLTPRLDPKPWGGRRLAEYGLTIPDGERLGEAVMTADDALVETGPDAGRSLVDLIAPDAHAFIGQKGLAATDGRPTFPLLLKLIDAAQHLSIQVHPDDAAARPLGKLGKTEAWHVLAAEPGACLYVGLRPGVTAAVFADAVRSGQRVAPLLRRLPALPGSTILLPAGTAHALGAGVMVYEVQQQSDITYRLDDWGRVDPVTGLSRELHLDKGLGVLKPELRPDAIPPVRLPSDAGLRFLLVACRKFAVERITLQAGDRIELRGRDTPQALTALCGIADIAGGGAAQSLRTGQTAVTPAGMRDITVRATEPAVLLRAWIPDLLTDVIVPAMIAGASPQQVAALAGPLSDLRTILPTASTGLPLRQTMMRQPQRFEPHPPSERSTLNESDKSLA